MPKPRSCLLFVVMRSYPNLLLLPFYFQILSLGHEKWPRCVAQKTAFLWKKLPCHSMWCEVARLGDPSCATNASLATKHLLPSCTKMPAKKRAEISMAAIRRELKGTSAMIVLLWANMKDGDMIEPRPHNRGSRICLYNLRWTYLLVAIFVPCLMKFCELSIMP